PSAWWPCRELRPHAPQPDCMGVRHQHALSKDRGEAGSSGNRVRHLGKAPADSLTVAEARPMVRTLLEERFQLRWRLQPREVDGYLLIAARDDGRPGPALQPFTGDCEARKSNTSVRF